MGDTKYSALAANVTPEDPGLRHFVVSCGWNLLIKGDNDLVVPTRTVYAENGSGFFPIEEKLVREGDEAVSHTKYFENAAVQGKIVGWLGNGALGLSAGRAQGPARGRRARLYLP